MVDLKKDRGLEVFRRLVGQSDVLIEGFRPGVMDRLGVGYTRLSELNPRLVYCALTGYGQAGPYVAVPGHDMNYVALSGALSMIGPKGGAPCFPSHYLARPRRGRTARNDSRVAGAGSQRAGPDAVSTSTSPTSTASCRL